MPKRHRQPDISHLTFTNPEENIEDYGDRPPVGVEEESCNSDEYNGSEMGNDGNVSSSAGTPREDTDSSLMMRAGSDNSSSGSSSSSSSDNENDNNGEEEEEEDDNDNASLINVDFGVFEMKPRDVDAVMHLMDQLCPDKMNEVDRDELGAALHESSFTSVVKIATDDDEDDEDDDIEKNNNNMNDTDASDNDNNNNNNNNNNKDDDDEEEEIYGMSSILNLVHNPHLSSLLTHLKKSMWRTITPGILPTDMLVSCEEVTGKAKCLLLVGEYIRNVPLELTSHILQDLLERFQKMHNTKRNNSRDEIKATFPCMFAVLSKIQRAVDAPVTTTTREDTVQNNNNNNNNNNNKKKKRRQSVTQQEEFDLTRYVFWREEDSILYEHRDKRIATVAYRCRPQYDGQPENDIPISLLYVLPYNGLEQAIVEIRKREATQTSIVHY